MISLCPKSFVSKTPVAQSYMKHKNDAVCKEYWFWPTSLPCFFCIVRQCVAAVDWNTTRKSLF